MFQRYDILALVSIVVLYVVLGAPNLLTPWGLDLAHPAAEKLRQNAQVLLREVLELSGSRPGIMYDPGIQARLLL